MQYFSQPTLDLCCAEEEYCTRIAIVCPWSVRLSVIPLPVSALDEDDQLKSYIPVNNFVLESYRLSLSLSLLTYY
jgi:hypothetical protein